MSRDRIYPTQSPALKPRPEVALRVCLTWFLLGVLASHLTTCAVMR